MKRFALLASAALIGLSALPALAQSPSTLRIGLQEDPDVLDPHKARTFVGRIVFKGLCDKLLDITPELKIVPRLATEWSFSDDGLTLTMKLRSDAKFHDGEAFALGEAAVTANDLVSASLRMRPDRIILGELRGPEAFAFLRAVNTGHPGSMTTIHADGVERAFEQLALLVLQGGSTLQREDILAYVRTTVDVVLQLSRDASGRSVSALFLRDR